MRMPTQGAARTQILRRSLNSAPYHFRECAPLPASASPAARRRARPRALSSRHCRSTAGCQTIGCSRSDTGCSHGGSADGFHRWPVRVRSSTPLRCNADSPARTERTSHHMPPARSICSLTSRCAGLTLPTRLFNSRAIKCPLCSNNISGVPARHPRRLRVIPATFDHG
jgi:hypothetical protein